MAFGRGCCGSPMSGPKKELFVSSYGEYRQFSNALRRPFCIRSSWYRVLYSLSAVAGYKITGDEHCKQEVIQAADVLLARFQEREFIQAWGAYGDPQEYRLIIDSLLNLPLLFAATQLSESLVTQRPRVSIIRECERLSSKMTPPPFIRIISILKRGSQVTVRRIKETATNRFGHEGKAGDFRASFKWKLLA